MRQRRRPNRPDWASASSPSKNADIASQMFVSIPTVKTHLAHIFTKLNIATRAELAARAARRS